MKTVSGKAYLVTGASRGIGAATAGILLEQGARVIGSYASSIGAMELLGEKYGADNIIALQADFTKLDAANTLFDQACEWAGSIAGVVNNAGVMPEASPEAPLDEWHKAWSEVMQVNVQAVADICKLAVAHFKGNGGGALVNVASRAAFRGDGADYMHYAASKGAVVALTRSIARAYARDGVFAYIIAPGWVRTDMASVAYEPGNDWMLDEVPLGRAAEPVEVGEMIAFLLSGKAESATGATFDINGASYVR